MPQETQAVALYSKQETSWEISSRMGPLANILSQGNNRARIYLLVCIYNATIKIDANNN